MLNPPGNFLTKNAIIAFGCTIMNEKLKEVDSFEGYMKIPKDKKYEKKCVDEFWSKEKYTLSCIEKKMKKPKEVMNNFAKWLDEMDLKYGYDLIVLSDNASYDYAWINMYLSHYTIRPLLYYKFNGIGNNKKNYGFRRTLMEKTKGKYI